MSIPHIMTNGNPAGTNGKKPWDRYEIVNSIIIWLSVVFILTLVVFTSYDYSKSPATFTLFGQNQLFLLGFIILLLLFRYIRKIKIGDIIDIEFDALEKHIDNLLNTTNTAIIGAKTLATADITPIREELLQAKGNIENIKAKARRA